MATLMGGIGIFWYLGSFLVAIGLLVVVHELGHFAVARCCGVKVLRFSVGFGKPLVTWRLGTDRTEWSIAAFPLGGYVKMLDEREAAVEPAELPRAFNRQPIWRRMLIVAAGPLANLLLAVFLYWAMFLHGVQDIKPLLGLPVAGSIAARAEITPQEHVLSVNGKPVATWTEVRMDLLQVLLEQRSVTLETINPRGEIAFRKLGVDPGLDLGDDPTMHLGLRPYRPAMPATIGSVVEASRGESAGLRAGDSIIAIDGDAVRNWDDVVTAIRAAPERALQLEVKRESGNRLLQVRPEQVMDNGQPIGRLGIAPRQDPRQLADMMVDVNYGVMQALTKALEETWTTTRLSVVMMGRMLTGAISWRHLSGPVAIADYAGQSARLGISPYLKFLALISISVGILNLLPVPVLDGGHLLYYLAEFFKGSPVSEKAQMIGQYLGLGVLGLLMAIALFNDIYRHLSG